MGETLLFYGGRVLTMEEKEKKGEPGSADAVLVEDGLIRAVGSREELEPAARGARRIDLEGNLLMPSFLDSHSHFTQVAYSFFQVSLDGAASLEEIQERVKSYLSRKKPGKEEWVVARDYDHNLMPKGAHPTLAQLDEMTDGQPMIIQHKSGHMGLVNSRGLALLGITDESQAPEGGRIGKEGGRLTGYLEENAFFDCLKRVPMPGEEELAGAYEQAQQLYASHGITTIQEGMLVKQMFPMYDLLLKRKLLWLDLVAYPDLDSFDEAVSRMSRHRNGYRDHLRLGGIKIFLDGSPQGRTAWMKTPYMGTEDCGYGILKDDQVTAAFEKAAGEKVQLLAHCNGDAAAEQFLRCLEQAERTCPNLEQLRPVLIHGQLMEREQLKRAAKLGAVVSFFVAHVYHWGDVHIRNFGYERASAISPLASALKADLPFTLHQDSPVIQPDMWETVWCAANRVTREGVLLGPGEKIPVWQALRAVTYLAAWQYGEEARKGTIAPGKRADLLVADADPLTVPSDQLRDIRVLQTYKDGRCVYSR